MKWKYEKEFREKYPQTIGETDKEFDLDNYKDFLEELIEKANGVYAQLADVLAEFEPMIFDFVESHNEENVRLFLKDVLGKYFS